MRLTSAARSGSFGSTCRFLFLDQQRLSLGVKLLQRGFQRLDGLLCLSFDARRLFGFFGSDTLLLF